jgi:hypothetical protein
MENNEKSKFYKIMIKICDKIDSDSKNPFNLIRKNQILNSSYGPGVKF